MKKSNKKTIVLIAILLLAIIIAICGIIYTNAKYISMANGKISTSIAKWAFNLNGNDTYSSTDTIKNLTIAQTCDEKTLVDGKIAPGTSGSFDIVIDTEGSEVGANYEVKFSLANDNALPTNLKFKLDGADWNYTDGISGKIDADASSKEITHTIAWSWDYETENGDTADTTDGTNSLDCSFNITATGIQMKPVAK